jgi:hypothetical protein
MFMGIVRLSSSGSQLQFVSDDGVVFVTSVDYVRRLLSGLLRKDFIVLSRFAVGVSPDRFPRSPVWGVGVRSFKGVVDIFADDVGDKNRDAFSRKGLAVLRSKPVDDVML